MKIANDSEGAKTLLTPDSEWKMIGNYCLRNDSMLAIHVGPGNIPGNSMMEEQSTQ